MKNISLLGLLLLVFFSCRQDIEEDGKIEITTQPPIIINEYDPTSDLVSGTIYGRVYDENEIAIEGATVQYEGKTFSTDAEGRFFIENEPLDRQGTFFTVEADGYFKGSRRIYPKDGSVNYAYVQLLELNDAGSFDAATGGEIVGSDGIRITFSENSIQSSTGGLYNGEVTVAAKWLDPTAPNIAEIMPGDLLGLSARVEEVSLVTYGMMAVELFDENGNNVNIAEGRTATLSFPVPQELINEAPAEIPLWSFEDEQYGIWAEEGMATLQGDRYVGQVSHFSFWNCDVPFPLVYIEGQLVTEEGIPLPNATICISSNGSNSGRCGTTDNEGYFAGKMPKDSDLVLKFGYQAQDCAFSSINLGSFSDDTNLGSIQVTESGVAFTVTGSIVDCDNNPITNGLVKFQIGNIRSEYYVGDDGSFEVAILNCDNASEISITAVDIDNFEEGSPVSMQISPEVNFGTIAACGNPLTEYFTLNVDGRTSTINEDLVVYFQVIDSVDYVWSPLIRVNETLDSFNMNVPFAITFNNVRGTIGTYDSSDIIFLDILIVDPVFNESAFLNQFNIITFEMTITENGGEGGFWAGEFSGTGVFTNRDDKVLLILTLLVESLEFQYNNLKKPTEIEIIKGCKAQDQQLQKELVLRYSPMLMTISLRYTDSKPAAQDILQDSLVKIIKSVAQYQHGGSFTAWMKRIVINTALKSKSRKRYSFEHSGLQNINEPEMPAEAYSNLNAKELMHLIDTLPRGFREIFNLAAVEGYSHKEIGELLNITPSTSRSQLARARKILQNKLIQLEKMTA